MSTETRRKIQDVIIEYGGSYQEFGEKIPKQYINLHLKIGTMRKNGKRVIPYSLLVKANSALKKPLSMDELEVFVQFQHNCGFLLYFRDARLNHLVVLDPRLIIDATKSIVTSNTFALDTWDKEKWSKMVTTGKIDASYILEVWKKISKDILFKYRDYLLNVLQRLDIIAKPKAYEEGNDIHHPYYYVPCMLQATSHETEWSFRDADMTLSFQFKNLLPPAVVHKVFASCLGLWQVEANCLYDGWAAFASGQGHIIFLQRKPRCIAISIRHRYDPAKIDVNLVRSVKHFLIQTIQRIVSFYDATLEKDPGKIYRIEYNQSAISRGIGVQERKVTKIILLLLRRNLIFSLMDRRILFSILIRFDSFSLSSQQTRSVLD